MDAYIKKLANAIFNNEPELVQKYLDKIPDGSGEPLYDNLPLHYIAKCVEISLETLDSYTEAFRPRAEKAFKDNASIKQMLIEKFEVDFNEPIPFHELGQAGYFPVWNEDEDSLEDVFETNDITLLKSLGATDLDLELYCEVMKFNFAKVEELMKQGARPDAEIFDDDEYTEEDGGWTAITWIGQEIIGLPQVFNTAFLLDEKEPIKELGRNLYFLRSLAAHNEMFNLLLPYCAKKEKE